MAASSFVSTSAFCGCLVSACLARVASGRSLSFGSFVRPPARHSRGRCWSFACLFRRHVYRPAIYDRSYMTSSHGARICFITCTFVHQVQQGSGGRRWNSGHLFAETFQVAGNFLCSTPSDVGIVWFMCCVCLSYVRPLPEAAGGCLGAFFPSSLSAKDFWCCMCAGWVEAPFSEREEMFVDVGRICLVVELGWPMF